MLGLPAGISSSKGSLFTSGRCRWPLSRQNRHSHICNGKKKSKRRNMKMIPMRSDQNMPDPPSVEEYLAPPMPGTEEILRNACNKKNALDDAHLKPKENCVPWLLDVDFENDMDVWSFIDSFETEEIWRQRRKHRVKYHKDLQIQKQYLLEFWLDQQIQSKKSHEQMLKRLEKANAQAERRAIRREKRPILKEAKKIRAAADAPRKPPAISDNILPYHEGDLDAPVWQEGGLFDDCF